MFREEYGINRTGKKLKRHLIYPLRITRRIYPLNACDATSIDLGEGKCTLYFVLDYPHFSYLVGRSGGNQRTHGN